MNILAVFVLAAIAVLERPLFWILLVTLSCASILASAIRAAGRSIGLALIRSSPGYIKMASEESDEAAKDKYWAEEQLPPAEELVSYEHAKRALED